MRIKKNQLRCQGICKVATGREETTDLRRCDRFARIRSDPSYPRKSVVSSALLPDFAKALNVDATLGANQLRGRFLYDRFRQSNADADLPLPQFIGNLSIPAASNPKFQEREFRLTDVERVVVKKLVS
jgi:hypothetical protein